MGVVDEAWRESACTGGHFCRPRASRVVDVGVAVATTAQTAWSGRTCAERAAVLRGTAAALTGRSQQFRGLIIHETGCSSGQADFEIGAATRRWLTVTEGPASYPY